jgi:DUF4097 and DUF4098 domain-containing protein YvlB
MRLGFLAMGMFIVALPAAAQQKSLSCDQKNYNNNRQVTHCEMREQTVAFPGRLAVDAGINGGVSVKGWDNGSVLVRAKVEASGDDDGAAAAVVSQITVNTSAGQVTASGPEQTKGHGWQVSYEIFVPRQGDLSLKAHNGGIAISDVRGNIQFDTMNGGVTLKRLAGDVEGKTMNGGVNVELAGVRWDGTKLDARTTNGGVTLSMPEGYSAHFETATINGHLNLAFPVTVHGEIGQRLVTDIGSGGPTIHVETMNGGVNVKKM